MFRVKSGVRVGDGLRELHGFTSSSSDVCQATSINASSNETVNFIAPRIGFLDELVLFPQGVHDDLLSGLQTMVEGTTSYAEVRAVRYSSIPRW